MILPPFKYVFQGLPIHLDRSDRSSLIYVQRPYMITKTPCDRQEIEYIKVIDFHIQDCDLWGLIDVPSQ